MNKAYKHPGYNQDIALIPHGVSVAVTAPMVFRFTGASNPERHLRAAQILGVDITNAKAENAGAILEEAIKNFILKLDNQPQGIAALGYTAEDIPELVKATLPQQRVLQLAPEKIAAEDLTYLFEKSLHW